MAEILLEVKNLHAGYNSAQGFVHAVNDISFTLEKGKNMGLVGESGCGKSSLIKALTKVFPKNFALKSGQVLFEGTDLVPLSYDEMRPFRWDKIALVPQSAMNALNPAYKVGYQIEEAILAHRNISRHEASKRVEELFQMVGINPQRAKDYPHQFSGGMKQRANMAMALALTPSLLIADEPTTALDVIVQDQIFQRILHIQKNMDCSMLLITHDISLVAENCDVMAVMYGGKLMEYGSVEKIFSQPMHPYTLALKNAFPNIQRSKAEALISIPKSPPSLIDFPEKCRFASRCPFCTELCKTKVPLLKEVLNGHLVACHYPEKAEYFQIEAQKPQVWEQIAQRQD